MECERTLEMSNVCLAILIISGQKLLATSNHIPLSLCSVRMLLPVVDVISAPPFSLISDGLCVIDAPMAILTLITWPSIPPVKLVTVPERR